MRPLRLAVAAVALSTAGAVWALDVEDSPAWTPMPTTGDLTFSVLAGGARFSSDVAYDGDVVIVEVSRPASPVLTAAFGSPGAVVRPAALPAPLSHVTHGAMATPIPEMKTYALMLAGLAVIGFISVRRSRQP